MIPKDIDKWDNNQWMRQVVYCRPSSGGAVGVIFVWAGRAYSAQSLTKSSEAAFVIKPIQGSAAPTKFAEHLLSKIGGAHSPNSKPISRRSPGGSGLMLALKMFRDKETDSNVKQRWQAVFQHYDRADAFLIQETQVGIREFGDEYRKPNELQNLLSDQKLMTNLGKLFAADAFIGNGDRLSNPNTGNIIFKPDGTLCSIDSTTILTSFQAILNDKSGASDSSGGAPNAQNWATEDIIKQGYLQVPSDSQKKMINSGKAPALAPSFAMNLVFDVDTWWTKTFRSHLEDGVRKSGGQPPQENVWNQAKIWFKTGVTDGLKQVDSKLSGLNWIMIKQKYKDYTSKYGGDPNLDWRNFKIRRLYFKLRNSGKTEQQAMQEVQEYVKRKLPGL